ncbi:MAG: hypothetical protein MUQ65_12990, partial [Armatimonadetes bacterium]|nr:hypothetical protein [Armatimonadota bacterium]
MRKLIGCVVALLIIGPVLADDAVPTAKKGEAEFRAGWLAVVAPRQGTQTGNALQARQEALLSAIPHFEAAVAAEPDNADYRTALVYAELAAGKYQQASDAVSEAIARKKDSPLLYLLRAQADAALAHMDPETAPGKAEKVIQSFEDAAHLDPSNSLYALQAASVAFDAGRGELALKKIEEALQLPGITLYRLPIPGDLDPNRTTAIQMWQHVQMSQWSELLARCQNAARMTSKLSKDKLDAGELDAAEALLTQALEIGRQIGNAKPNLFISVNSALNVMHDAYAGLAAVAKAKQDPAEENRWTGEGGVLIVARQDLFAAVQRYVKLFNEEPPASIDDLIQEEAEQVAHTMLGA